jgi:DNA-binding beta-propeller fold protein YncE
VQTDSEGRFIFEFMEETLGDTVYHFYVDLCGLPMDGTHIFSINAGDDLIEGLDLCINEDVTGIDVCSITGIVRLTSDTEGDINIFPNPASNEVVVTTGTGGLTIVSLEIRDMIGRSMLNMAANEVQVAFSVSDMPAGLYVVSITLHDGSTRSHRMLVTH